MSVIGTRLERDLDWRRAELAELKLLIGSSAIATSDRDRSLLRAIFAMLYAHFEGFLRFALESYVDELTSMRLKTNRLSNDLLPIAMRNALGSYSKLSKKDFLFELLRSYRSSVTFTLDFGEGNFWPDKVEKLLAEVALQSLYLSKDRLRLKSMVSRRNDIAHGKPLSVRSLKEYKEVEDAAITVMYEVAIAIDEAISCASYLK